MALFWSKKEVENVDPTLKEELRSLKARITRLESEILDLMTAQEIIRNKILRKIQSKKDPEEETSKDIYNGVLIKSL